VHVVRPKFNVTPFRIVRHISESRNLREPTPSVNEQPNDCGVAAGLKVAPSTGRQERFELLVRENGGRLFYDLGLTHALHGRSADQPLTDGPLKELLQSAETVRRGSA
jgi:hypothetical protein